MRKFNRRRLNRSFLGLLPETLRLSLIRGQARVKREWPSPSLEIKIADTEEELERGYRLLHDSYVKAGFMDPHPTGMRVLPQHLLPQTTTIVAKWDGEVMGTLSLIRDNLFGLPLEKIFDVSSRRKGGRRLAEISSLAIDPAFRKKASVTLFPLFRFVYHYARFYFGTHEFVIAVNPSMVDLYLSLMCFDRLEKSSKSYDFVKGAKAVGLYLDFETCVGKWEGIFGRRPDSGNFAKYWTQIPDESRNHLPRREYLASTDPMISPELLENFFMNKAELWRSLTLPDLQALSMIYSHPRYGDVFETVRKRHSLSLRSTQRIDVQMPAVTKEGIGEVLNVSKNGLQFRFKPSLQEGQILTLKINLGSDSWTSIQAQVQWVASGLYGLQVVTPSVEWLWMVRTLQGQFDILTGGAGNSGKLRGAS